MGDLFLTIYVCMYVPEPVTLRNVDNTKPNAMCFLPANCVLFAARTRRYEKYNIGTPISGQACGASRACRARAVTCGVEQ